jgi:2-phosphosulfolactate phosphatase
MKINQISLDGCDQAAGLVVVIDVLRAFTTAAFAFAAGAAEILLVGDVAEAFAGREQWPDALLMGEVEGRAIPGFDFGNSPTALDGLDLNGRRFIQRTSAGTQGVVRSTQADTIFAASFVCAGATARAILALRPEQVTFVNTGIYPGGYGEEDVACSDYLAALLRGEQPDPAPYLARVRESRNGRFFATPTLPDLPGSDLERATDLDRFDFAMRARREGNGWWLTAVTL